MIAMCDCRALIALNKNEVTERETPMIVPEVGQFRFIATGSVSSGW